MERADADGGAGTRIGAPERAAVDDEVVGGLRVTALLGRGACTAVYRAARDDGREYAVKIMRVAPHDHGRTAAAFRREAGLLAGVRHPALPRIHEVGEHESRPYLVMDLVTGSPLDSLVQAGAMPADLVVRIALDVAGALLAVHRRGVVHRDVKPHNIIVTPDDRARLIDFGLALVTARDADGVAPAVGTLAYAPPEQSGLLRRPVDHRSDLYSLGVVLFECLAGAHPFATDDVGELLRAHAGSIAPDLHALVPSVPPALARVIATLLAKDPDDRYCDTADLVADLLTVATGLGVAPEVLASATPEAAAPLVGRDGELGQLLRAWNLARGGRGAVVTVRGEVGAGVHRLVDELVDHVTGEGLPALALTTSDTELDVAVSRAVRRAGLRPGPLRDRLPELLAEAAGRADGGVSPTGAPESAEQLATATSMFLGRLAGAADGLLLHVDVDDDLGPGTERILRRVVAALRTTPLLLVLTGHTGAGSPETPDLLHQVVRRLGVEPVAQVRLERLDQATTCELVARLLPGLGATTSVARLIAARCGGNPGAVVQYTQALLDAGLLTPGRGGWLLDEPGLSARELPADVLGLMLARLDQLTPRTRDLLGTAAALGPTVRPDVLAAAAGAPSDAVQSALAEGVATGLLEIRDGGTTAFLHDRVRAALEPSDAGTARQVHQRIADALDRVGPATLDGHADHVAALAWHTMLGHPEHDPDRSVRIAADAGRAALDRHAPEEAVRLLEFAHQLCAQLCSGPVPEILADLGRALTEAARFDEAVARLEEALRLPLSPLRRAGVLASLAACHRACWRTDAARAAVAEGLAVLDAAPPRHGLARLLTASWLLLRARRRAQPGRSPDRAVGHGFEEETERLRLIVELHVVGSYLALTAMDSPALMESVIRGRYWATRLGPAPESARATAMFGFLLSASGLAGASARAFDQAEADVVGAAPAVRAFVEHMRGAGTYFGGHDDGETWRTAARRDAPWLELWNFSDAVASLFLDAVCLGRTEEAEEWRRLAEQRFAIEDARTTTLFLVEPMALAASGRAADAAAAERAVRAEGLDRLTPGNAVMHSMVSMLVLLEQGEIGDRLTADLAAFEALRLPVSELVRTTRWMLAHQALALLARARATRDEADLRQAAVAVQRLRKAASSASLKAFAAVARADLELLRGRAGQALRELAVLDSLPGPDAPLIAFEAARVRARAALARGRAGEAARQIALAQLIARTAHWPHRERWLVDEFGSAVALATASSPLVPGVASSTHTRTTGDPSGSPDAALDRRRLAALTRVSAAAVTVFDPLEVARVALDELVRTLAAERAVLFMPDPTGQWRPVLARDDAGQDVDALAGYGHTLVEKVAATREPLVVTGTEQGAALGSESAVQHGLRSILVAPLLLEDRLLGVVYLDSRIAKGIFSSADLATLTAVTAYVAASLETARAAELEISERAACRRQELAERLRHAVEALSGSLEPAEVLDRLCTAARDVVECDASGLLEAGALPADALSADALSADALSADALSADALSADAGPAGLEAAARRFGAPAGTPTEVVAVPLHAASGPLGHLVLIGWTAPLDSEAAEIAAALVAPAMAAYDRAVLFERTQNLAVADELTGLPNRRRFFEIAGRDVAAAHRYHRRLALLMIDIDHFKAVNDTYGHLVGDDVIREVARRLAAGVRSTDVVGRYGGEEFAVVLPESKGGDVVPERLRAAMEDEPVPTRSGPVAVTVSIGMAWLQPGDDVVTTLGRADEALYRAKEAGRNRVEIAPEHTDGTS